MGKVDVESIAAAIDDLTKENQRLQGELEAANQAKASAESMAAEEREKNAVFEPYRDILEEEWTGEWKEVKIRNAQTYKSLLLATKREYGNIRPMSIASMVNNILEYGLSKSVLSRIVKMKEEQLSNIARL